HRLGGAALCVVQLRPAELGSADLFGTSAQQGDRRDDVERRLPGTKPIRLLGDDRLRSLGLAAAVGKRLDDDSLEVVDVVEITAVELVDRRVEVARHRKVDQEQRAAL